MRTEVAKKLSLRDKSTETNQTNYLNFKQFTGNRDSSEFRRFLGRRVSTGRRSTRFREPEQEHQRSNQNGSAMKTLATRQQWTKFSLRLLDWLKKHFREDDC